MLQENQRRKLTKQIALFSSSIDGEVLSAVNAANKTLSAAKMDWLDIAASLNTSPNEYNSHEVFQAGYSAGYRAGQSAAPQTNTNDYHQMLLSLKSNEAKLNTWAISFVTSLLITMISGN